jgi:hypothetical protein
MQGLTSSYRIAIWTRSAPDLSHPDTEALKAKILAVGRFWKGDVLGYSETNKLVAGGLQSGVEFESHKVSLYAPFVGRSLTSRTRRRRVTRTRSLFNLELWTRRGFVQMETGFELSMA